MKDNFIGKVIDRSEFYGNTGYVALVKDVVYGFERKKPQYKVDLFFKDDVRHKIFLN